MVSSTSNGSSNKNDTPTQLQREPLVYSGSLDSFSSFDVTTVIGREFPDVQLMDLVSAPNADTLLRDLAIISTCCHAHESSKQAY